MVDEPCDKFVVCGFHFCASHGGGNRCNEPDCQNLSKGPSGKCKRHGGGTRCIYAGPDGPCGRSARDQKSKLCMAHGGGPRCTHPDCDKASHSGGKGNLCKAHGGGKRCMFSGGCGLSAQPGTDLCRRHMTNMQQMQQLMNDPSQSDGAASASGHNPAPPQVDLAAHSIIQSIMAAGGFNWVAPESSGPTLRSTVLPVTAVTTPTPLYLIPSYMQLSAAATAASIPAQTSTSTAAVSGLPTGNPPASGAQRRRREEDTLEALEGVEGARLPPKKRPAAIRGEAAVTAFRTTRASDDHTPAE